MICFIIILIISMPHSLFNRIINQFLLVNQICQHHLYYAYIYIFQFRMRENKKRLTLRTPYQTLLSHVWQFKRQTSELDKQNQMLKTKINFQSSSSKPNKKSQSKQKDRKTVQKRQIINYSGQQQPSRDLLQKLEQLRQENYGLKRQITQLDQNKKTMMADVNNLKKIQRKIARTQKKLKNHNNRIKKQKALKKKRIQLTSQHQLQGAALDVLQDQIALQKQKTAEYQTDLTLCNERLQKVIQAQKKLGRQIIQLINQKNILRKQLKNDGNGGEKNTQ